MAWALPEHMAEKYLVGNFTASINPQLWESHLSCWMVAKDVSGLPVYVGDRWRGWGLVPLFSFHLAAESTDHKPQPGAPFPQTFCPIFLVEMTERHCDPGPSIRKACSLPRKVKFFFYSGLIYNEAVKKYPSNKWVECGFLFFYFLQQQ